MKIETVTQNGQTVACITADRKLVTDVQSALELMMTVRYEAGTKNIVLDKQLIADEFFILSTGLAGEILQKFINYGVRCAIYGDYSHYTSKPLHDFIYECNHGRDVFFVSDKETAVACLCC